jgi:hypothetical protein
MSGVAVHSHRCIKGVDVPVPFSRSLKNPRVLFSLFHSPVMLACLAIRAPFALLWTLGVLCEARRWTKSDMRRRPRKR